MIENIDFVICQVCKKSFKFLGVHILVKHNINKEDYIKSFPNAKIICEVSRNKISSNLSTAKLTKTFHSKKLKLNSDGIENIDFVVCHICNKQFITVTNHVILTHKLKIEQYLQQFTNAVLISQIAKDANSINLSERSLEQRVGKAEAIETRKRLSASHADGKRKEGYKKCSSSLKGRSMEELFGKEEADRRKQNLHNIQTGISYEEKYGKEKADELRQLYSKQRIGHVVSTETVNKISEALKKRPPHSQERCDKIGKTLRERHADGSIVPAGGVVKGRRTYYNHPLQGNILLKSSTEYSYVKLLEYLSENFRNFVWFYEAEHFTFTGESGKQTTLTPDFTLLFNCSIEQPIASLCTIEHITEMINNCTCKRIVEIKGYWNEKHQAYKKWQLFRQAYSNENAIIFTCQELNKIMLELNLKQAA